MARGKNMAATIVIAFALAGCARTQPMQPDRAVFNVDASYQHGHFAQPIEATFDRTVAVFREAGYTLDIVDRATGQISGRRGKTGDKGARQATDLKFYALVMPDPAGSQIALRIVQIASDGIPVLTQAKTEVVLNQPELYAYILKRIEGNAPSQPTADPTDLPTPATEPSYQQ